MKPRNIYLIRHGESYGNIDIKTYEKTPDWQIPLTEKGKTQAKTVCNILWKKLQIDNWIEKINRPTPYTLPLVAVYCSPWYRARETAAPFMERLKAKMPLYTNPLSSLESIPTYSYKEDPRLREQEWGNFKEEPWSGKIARERKKFGTFFYRMPFGESGADVFDRISTFNETLHRDFKNPNFPENMVIFSHGLTIRIFLMRWFHWTVEEFQNIRNPRNGQIFEMIRLGEESKFMLTTKLQVRDSTKL
jgi:broad specificity phosphatase PhoE